MAKCKKTGRNWILIQNPIHGVRAEGEKWTHTKGWQYKYLSLKQIERILADADEASRIK